MQPCHLALRGLEQREPIVLNRHLPEKGADIAADLSEVAREPACQVDQVNALVEHLTTAGDSGVRAPLVLVPQAPTMAVARADVHQRAQRPSIEDRTRLL